MSVIKHKEQRVGIFIDTQNLYHSAKNLYGGRVNFGAIMKEAVGNRALIRAVAYVITTESGEEKNFFEALGKLGIEAKTKNIQIFGSGAKKADWDVGLAVDAIKLAPKLDTIIIASGDGDFIPLVEYLQTNEGCQVEVISFGKSSSGRLKEVADDFIDMCQNPKKYIIGTQRIYGPRPMPVGRGGRNVRLPRTAPVDSMNGHTTEHVPESEGYAMEEPVVASLDDAPHERIERPERSEVQ